MVEELGSGTITAIQIYVDEFQSRLLEFPDGAWCGGEEHRQAFDSLLVTLAQHSPDTIATTCRALLTTSACLDSRYEVLRILAHQPGWEQYLHVLRENIERARFDILWRRRVRCFLLSRWGEDACRPDLHAHAQVPEVVQLQRQLRAYVWFALPNTDSSAIEQILMQMAELGEPGLFGIDQVLGEVLDERRLMASTYLQLFRAAARLFSKYRYFEGVQVFFDFLADCAPVSPSPEASAAVGAVLKAIRKLRPYRYPKWAAPLRRFTEHYKKINKMGRAAEANMLIILISASSLEEALLLEDDELVDLLRGRRDAAYTDEELAEVAALCDALLEAGRRHCKILHIRGWLAARLDGPAAGVPFFEEALDLEPNYIYSHLALASLREMEGDEESRDMHLEIACYSEPTLISCHRKFGEILFEQDRWEEAEAILRRGTTIKPDDGSALEIEEFFGCWAALAQLKAEQYGPGAALQELDQWNREALIQQFGLRLLRKNRVIVELLQKGLCDLRAEFQHAVAVVP